MADNKKPEDIRKATSDGLQRIYLIIIGFAITQALKQTLTDTNGFLGQKLDDNAHWISLLLLISFLVTIIRFAHGSVLHLTALTGQNKWQWDMLVLISQAILFFILALTTTDIKLFFILFPLLMVIDSIWLVVLYFFDHITKMESEWLISNIALAIVFVILFYSNYYCALPNIYTATFSALACAVATFFDYKINAREYFP